MSPGNGTRWIFLLECRKEEAREGCSQFGSFVSSTETERQSFHADPHPRSGFSFLFWEGPLAIFLRCPGVPPPRHFPALVSQSVWITGVSKRAHVCFFCNRVSLSCL